MESEREALQFACKGLVTTAGCEAPCGIVRVSIASGIMEHLNDSVAIKAPTVCPAAIVGH